ncbi:MAG TPA: ATP-binding protein [Thermodesulfovibrionales bacterium]|nr:ATP-binding protein [Thermodesulfovibrionales bacterium]
MKYSRVYYQALQGMERFYELSIRALSALIRVGRLGDEITQIDVLCKRILEIFSQELQFENCSIMLRDEDGEHLSLVAGKGKGDVFSDVRMTEKTTRIRVGEGIAGSAAETGKYIFVPDVCRDARFSPFDVRVPITSLLSIPLKNDEGVIGVMNFSHPLLEAFEENMIGLMVVLSNYVGQMITLTRLHSKIATWNEVLRTLVTEKERLALTLCSIGDGLITTDTEEKIIMVNKAAEELTGWKEEIVGRSLTDVFRIVDKESRRARENPVTEVLRTGDMVSLTRNTVLVARDGMERLVAMRGNPVLDRLGKMIGVVLVFRDLTESGKLEGELIREQKLESVGVLAAGIAHDFNNILTAILGNITLAKAYAKSEEKFNERLVEAERASLRARDLAQQLLTFSKGGEPVMRVKSLGELVKEIATFALRGSNVRCEFHLPAEPLLAAVDEGQISQVVQNIVLNAQQAMPGGGTVTVTCERLSITDRHYLPIENGEYIRISIHDEGIGIPEKNVQEIFDPYFTTKQKGSGLGLATSYSIVRKHNGHIAVESTIGVGTTFHVYLPASKERRSAKRMKEEQITTLHGKILIMDDEENVRNVAGEMARHFGCDVDFAKDGGEAIELYKQAKESGQPFDTVLMDLTIPGGMGGRDAVERLIEFDPGVKAIVASGYSDEPIMANYEKYGFLGAVKKPFRMTELHETLRRVLSL